MILFRDEHVAMILSGEKTQTRRTWAHPRVKPGKVYQARRVKAMMQKDGTFARLKVLAVRAERLGEISEADARAEGYPSREAYFEAWRRIYGVLDLSRPVTVVEFRLNE